MTEKQKQRRKAYDVRNAQPDKENLSDIICNKFLAQSAYQQADTVMWYLHCRSEVRTLNFLTAALESSKNCVIPYCTVDQNGQNKLGLWLLENTSELIPGTWGILEPPESRWGEKEVLPEQLDLVMVPGVAFDHQGGRLGNGAGYYDRLLNKVRADTVLSAVCYQGQLFPKIPMEAHDVYMDYVFTELHCYHENKKL